MKRLIVFLILIIFALAACGSGTSDTDPRAMEVTAISQQNAAVEVALAATQIAGEVSTVLEQQQERIIIRNASLSITVSDAEETLTEIMSMSESMGGWVVSSNSYHFTNSAGEESAQGSVTIRVPAGRLTEALDAIKAGALKVNSENVSGQDVTSEYVDISSRLANLEAAEQQLQDIMEMAGTIEEVLTVHNELTRVRGDIESLRGQIQYFDEASAFSSITVNVSPEEPSPIESQSAGWNPGNTAESALGVLVRIVQFVVDLAILLAIVVLPFALVIGVPVWIVWRRGRRAQ